MIAEISVLLHSVTLLLPAGKQVEGGALVVAMAPHGKRQGHYVSLDGLRYGEKKVWTGLQCWSFFLKLSKYECTFLKIPRRYLVYPYGKEHMENVWQVAGDWTGHSNSIQTDQPGLQLPV